MNQKQNGKQKVMLGTGEYGAWECTMLPDALGEEKTPDKIWVFARSLAEVAENVPGVESAVFLGKATCIADPLTPGVTNPAPELTAAIVQAAATLPELATCPFCGRAAPKTSFTHPPGVAADVKVLLCPNPACAMMINESRLQTFTKVIQ